VIISVNILVYAQVNNYSAKTAACITTDILKNHQTHYIYLLHSSNREGKFLRNFFQVENDFQTYSIPFTVFGMGLLI
jgi:hypothetical protein